MENISALSVLDGRYSNLVKDLREIFSEYALIKHRLFVELQWLKFLSEEFAFFALSKEEVLLIDGIFSSFSSEEALKVKEIERVTNHDLKAVEYYIKEKLEAAGLSAIKEWTHFACTSDDINNTAYALMLKSGRSYIAEKIEELIENLEKLALAYKKVPMMSRTHGQPASPTTMGKEIINFVWRLGSELENLKAVEIGAKMNGATGNYNAHFIAFPEIDWIEASVTFIDSYLDLKPILYSTQINPNHGIAQVLHVLIRISAVLMDLNKDMWSYISLSYFKQALKEGEVGSSTMPHKVNPIDFENSEGNLGMAVALMEHLSFKLLQSRFQRDLSDSTVLRNLGTVFGYMLIACKNTLKGLSKLELDSSVLEKDLKDNPELLAEAVQTVMRVYGEENPYEQLKNLSRGKKLSLEDFKNLIDSLEKVPEAAALSLKQLSPDKYTGLAEALVDRYFRESKS